MKSKPIGPKAHGAIDYGFATINALAPTLLNLQGPAKTLCYAFAGTQGLLNMLTDQPLALKKLVPFKVHGQLEAPYVPALLLLLLVTGAMKQRKTRNYFLAFFGIALANYLLTDYKANEPGRQVRVKAEVH